MAEIVISIVAKVAECLMDPLISEGKYFFCINNLIGEIDYEKNELISERENLVDRVNQAKQRAEEIEKPVEKWMSDVENLLKEVEDLDQRMKAIKSCFKVRFPTWKQYRLCKQMVNKKKEMEKFKGKSNTFQPFSHPAPVSGIQYQSIENFTYFESTKVAHDQLLEALEDEKTYIIGVYGMGGSGKTTLVTEVGKKVKGMKMFDKVILITISQTFNIRDVQRQMADALNVKLDVEDKKYRAERLGLNLQQKGRVLIILDDLWSEFNLKDIGIRLENGSMGALKIILTTRIRHTCVLMDCEKKIHMGLLHEGESWALFQKHAKIDDKFSESLDGVLKQLCGECKGLPVALKVVGSSLKGKSKAAWKMALRSLRNPYYTHDQVEGVGDAINCLKLSYDYLGDEKAKKLFLMCSMFPEDYKISIEDIIRYAIGLGLGDMFSLESSRDAIKESKNKLVESCLLMHVEESKYYVKMHDMIRDTAIWIAKNLENHKILVNVNKPFNNMVEDDVVRDCFAITSWYDGGDQVYHSLHAPNLKILLINGSLNLSHATFEGLKGLQILSIICDKYDHPSISLPLAIQFLTNLRTLRLNKWELGDISFISSLTKLEVLDLTECGFNELPNDLGNLKNLKLLDLSYCQFGQSICYNGAIGRCLQLEELYLSRSIGRLYYSQCVEDIITLPKLERFSIYHYSHGYSFESSRILYVPPDFHILKLHAAKRNLLQLAEIVDFEQLLGGFEIFFTNMVRLVGGMNSLKYLQLRDCSMIEHIFDSPSNSEVDLLIPKLVELVLIRLKSLKELIRGTSLQALCFLEKLENLEIRDCHQLHNIFPRECRLQNLRIITISSCMFGESLFSICNAQSMHCLEELNLTECDELKHIISNAREKVSNTEVESITTFPLQSSKFFMPRLKKLFISSCRNLVSTFPICCFEVLPPFEKITILNAPNLKLVFGECDRKHHSSHQCQIQKTQPDLNCLVLHDLENVVGLCPENNRARWPSSKELFMSGCPKLSASWIATMTSSKIITLSLDGFSELSMISRVGPTPSHILNIRYLKHLSVENCKNLKYIFSVEMHRSLPELVRLEIWNCNQLERIVLENEELLKLSNDEVYFPKLTNIEICNCNKMKSLFSVSMVRMLPKLTTLSIISAVKLEEVFNHDNGDNTHTDIDIVFPKLTSITLVRLPSFVDICKGVKLMVPTLLPPRVSSCPKIVPNFGGIQKTPPPKNSKAQKNETQESNDDYESQPEKYNDYESDEDVKGEKSHRDYDLDLSEEYNEHRDYDLDLS